ncbi:MAG: prenyltransferase, partial [Nannocystaceae bacterium]
MRAQLMAWLQAMRPLAQVNLAVPLLLGQAMAFAWRGVFSFPMMGWTLALSVSWHLLIVFANDYADRDA